MPMTQGFIDDVSSEFKDLMEQNKELKEKYEQGVKHVLTLTEENKELKAQQFDNMEELAKSDGMCLVDIKIFDKLIEEEEENKELKQFALKVHNFAYGTEWDDEGIVSAMDYDAIVEKMKKDEENKELKQESLFLRAECSAGGWNARDNDPQEFADSVKEYFMEYKEHDKIENVEELYEEWKEWANIE